MNSYATSTWKNFKTQYNSYSRFCRIFGYQLFPCSNFILCRYAVFISFYLKTFSSVAQYVSGVRTLHYLDGHIPLGSDPILIRILAGIKRKLMCEVQQAVPVTIPLLVAISAIVDISQPSQLVCFSALLVGFYLFLRSGNLVPKSQATFDPTRHLTRSSLIISESLILVVIQSTKTRQYGSKQLKVPLLPVSKQSICPKKWLTMMIRAIPASPEDPLFSIPTPLGNRALSYSTLAHQYKQWVQTLGLQGNYTLHGLRRRGATHAFETGISDHLIRTLGDWASNCFRRYIDVTMDSRLRASIMFADNI